MQPLAIGTRRFYFYGLVAVFLVVVPLLILFALGYRFDRELYLVPTGGLYIATDIAGASISLDTEPMRETGTFRRAFFIQNLEPGAMTVRVEKSGYYPWQKKLEIKAHVVTEAASFLLPTDPLLRPIPAYIDVPANGTTSPRINTEYLDVLEVFGFTASTTPGVSAAMPQLVVKEKEVVAPAGATSLPALDIATTTVERRGVAIQEQEGGIVAVWLRTSDDPPYFFCGVHDVCDRVVPIDTADHAVSHFDFFPARNDLVILSRSDGIFATEIDSRGGQNTQPLYRAENIDFRIGDRGEIFIKQGDLLFEVMI